MAWSENSCGKWHFFGLKERQDFEDLAAQPNKNSKEYPLGTYYASSVSKKTLKSAALSPDVNFFFLKNIRNIWGIWH